MPRRKRMGWLLLFITIMGAVCLVGFIVVVVREHSGSHVFRRYIIDPIPESVTDLRACGSHFWSYNFALRFGIDRSDVELILASKPFQKVANVTCEGRLLHFQWTPSRRETIHVSQFGDSKPSWLTPESWHGPEVWAYHEPQGDPHLKILMYNVELGKAYVFIASDH